ncbi:MAG: chemotaxis protein CheD [Azovibrio sp.]|nr:chemotaxis protein CheD [Azovibrio sp.]
MTHSTNQSPIFLQPGELYFGQAPCLIATLLGACVAIALWHPRRYIGGVCHDVLRSRRQAASAQADERYGDVAFALLLAQIDAHVARPSEFQAKLFGGGAMYATPEAVPTIGHDNILQGLSLALGRHSPRFRTRRRQRPPQTDFRPRNRPGLAGLSRRSRRTSQESSWLTKSR